MLLLSERVSSMFGMPVVCYLFLGGAGGGLCAVTGVAGLRVPDASSHRMPLSLKRFMRAALIIASATLALSALVLMADSNRPEAVMYMLVVPRATFLSVGAWLLIAGIATGCVLTLMWGFASTRRMVVLMRVLLVAYVVLGVAIAVYTGLFLSSMPSVSLWNTVLLPLLFLLSSLSCGIALLFACMSFTGAGQDYAPYEAILAKRDALLIVLEAAVAIAFALRAGSLLSFPSQDMAGLLQSNTLLSGDSLWLWCVIFVLCGLVVPFAFDVSLLTKGLSSVIGRRTLLATASCLVGSFAMRACLVAAAVHPVLEMQVLG